VLEEREMRVTQMSVFDRLLMDRIIWLAGPVNDRMSSVTQAQLMFLDMDNGKDITMHIDTPGGYVKSGLGIVDVIDDVIAKKRTK
jgi:ATP-dependent Clp protease, protease subunit